MSNGNSNSSGVRLPVWLVIAALVAVPAIRPLTTGVGATQLIQNVAGVGAKKEAQAAPQPAEPRPDEPPEKEDATKDSSVSPAGTSRGRTGPDTGSSEVTLNCLDPLSDYLGDDRQQWRFNRRTGVVRHAESNRTMRDYLQKRNLKSRCLIALVPSPVRSRQRYLFDVMLNSLQGAIESTDFEPLDQGVEPAREPQRYSYNSNWFPWNPNATGETVAAPSENELQPGVILFRRPSRPGNPSDVNEVLVVFLVAHSARNGIDKQAMMTALDVSWQLTTELPHFDKVSEIDARPQDRMIRILGPVYSGAQFSLEETLRKWTDRHNASQGTEGAKNSFRGTAWIDAYAAGTAIVPREGEDSAKEGKRDFSFKYRIGSLSSPDSVVLERMIEYVSSEHELRKLPAPRIALLFDNTGYGGKVAQDTGGKNTLNDSASNSRRAGRKPANEQKMEQSAPSPGAKPEPSKMPNAPDDPEAEHDAVDTPRTGKSSATATAQRTLIQIPYPAHLSEIHEQQAIAQEDAFKKIPHLRGFESVSKLPPDRTLNSDGLPEYGSGMTVIMNELVLGQMLDRLVEAQVEYVAIAATDNRDKLYLANLIHERLPDVRFLLTLGDLIYLHPASAAAFNGSLIGATYAPTPAFGTRLVLSPQEAEHNAEFNPNPIGQVERVFAMQVAQSYFNATRVHLGKYPLAGIEITRNPDTDSWQRAFEPVNSSWVNIIGTHRFYPIRENSNSQQIVSDYSRLEHARRFSWNAAMLVVWGSSLGLLLVFYWGIGHELATTGAVQLGSVNRALAWNVNELVSLRWIHDSPSRTSMASQLIPIGTMVVRLALWFLIAMSASVCRIVNSDMQIKGGMTEWTWMFGAVSGAASICCGLTLIAGVMQAVGLRLPFSQRNAQDRTPIDRIGIRAILVGVVIGVAIAVVVSTLGRSLIGTMSESGEIMTDAWFDRLTSLWSGVTPFLPVAAMTAGLVCWLLWLLRSTAWQDQGFDSQFHALFPVGDGIRTHAHEVCPRLLRLNLPNRFLAGLAALCIVLIATLWSIWERWLPTVDGIIFEGYCFTVFCILCFAIGYEVLQFTHSWRRIESLHHRIARLPIQSSISDLSLEFASRYGNIFYSPRARDRLTHWETHQIEMLLRTSGVDLAPKPPEESPFDRFAICTARPFDEVSPIATDKPICGRLIGLLTNMKTLLNEDCLRETKPQNETTSIRLSVLELAQHIIQYRREGWERLSSREVFCSQGHNDNSSAAATAEPVSSKWLSQCDDLLAMIIAISLTRYRRLLKHQALFLLLTTLLLFLSVGSYPFNPQSLLTTHVGSLVVLVLAAFGYVLTGLNRDELMSRITKTEPRLVSLDSGFIKACMVYGGPLFVLLTSRIPGVRDTLGDWLAAFGSLLPL